MLDRLMGEGPQLLGLAGALAQDRHQRLGTLQQLRKLRRPPAPAAISAILLRLGHPKPHSLAGLSCPRRLTLPAALTRGEMVDNVASRRQGCSRRAAEARAQKAGGQS